MYNKYLPHNVIILLLIFISDFLGLYCEMQVGIIPQNVLNVVPSGEQVFCCCLFIWFVLIMCDHNII